jgi:hypothetical protein
MKRVAKGVYRNRLMRNLILGATAVILCFAFVTSLSAQGNPVQEKFAALKQAAMENQQRLSQYTWTETTQLTLKGDPKPPTQDFCQYGPDGKVSKTPIGPPPEPPSGGRMKQRVIEKKKAEMQDYMGDVKQLLSSYLPPNPQQMQAAQQAGNISLDPAGPVVNLVFSNYVLPGDKMTVSFDPNARKIVGINVNTYMGQAKDAVTLQVQMATLPDGTSYTQQTVLTATAKQLVVTTTSFSYQKRY